MYKYNKLGFCIEVPLKDTWFFVRANILSCQNEDTYDVALELRKEGFLRWDMMDESHYTLHSKSINSDVYEMIMAKHRKGYFDYFMNIYDFETACVDKGIEYFEERHEFFYSDDPRWERPSVQEGG